MEKIISRKRIEWIDCGKGICICFVILMHSVKPTIYSRICVPVFLSMFFLTAGYTTSVKFNLSSTLKQLKCFVSYGIVVICLLYWLLGKALSFKPFIGMVLQVPTNTSFPEAIIWFLPCMIICKLIFQALYQLGGGGKLFICFMLIAGIAGALYINYIRICLPWHLQTALFMQSFMLMGYLLKIHTSFFKRSNIPLIIAILGLCYFTLIIALPIDADLCTLFFTNYPVYCLQTITGTLFGALVIQYFVHGDRFLWLQYIGRNSLFFYAFESAARFIIEKFVMDYFELDSIYITSLISVFCTVVLLTFVVTIINYVVNFIKLNLNKLLRKLYDEEGKIKPEELDSLLPWSETLPDECRKPQRH